MTENRGGPVLTTQVTSRIFHFQEFSKTLIAAVIRDAGEGCGSEHHIMGS